MTDSYKVFRDGELVAETIYYDAAEASYLSWCKEWPISDITFEVSKVLAHHTFDPKKKSNAIHASIHSEDKTGSTA